MIRYLLYLFFKRPYHKLFKKKWVNDKKYLHLLVRGKGFFGDYVIDCHPKLANKWGGTMSYCSYTLNAKKYGYQYCIKQAWAYRHKNPKLAHGFIEIGKHWKPINTI